MPVVTLPKTVLPATAKMKAGPELLQKQSSRWASSRESSPSSSRVRAVPAPTG